MEPLSDHELQSLLKTWKAPTAPEHLQSPLPRRGWYTGLWAMSVRIPVPVPADSDGHHRSAGPSAPRAHAYSDGRRVRSGFRTSSLFLKPPL